MNLAPSRVVLLLQGSAGFGGSKICLLNLLEALQQGGHKLVVACPDRGWLTEQLERLRIEFVLVPFFAWRKILERPRVRSSIRKKWRPSLDRWKFDIVHSNEFWWAPHALEIAELLKIPAVVHLRDGHHTIKKAHQYLLQQAGAIVASSSELRSRFDRDPQVYDRTCLIFDGHKEKYFQGDRKSARELFQLKPEDFVLGNAGRLTERKNQKMLLKVAAELKNQQRDSSIKILFAGDADPSYGSQMTEETKQLGLEGEVQFLGQVADMGPFFAAIDLFVHCSRREGLPSVVPEAMLCRKAIVATAAEGVRDAIPDERYGCVVPIDDQAALKSQIQRLRTNSHLRRIMGDYAYERANHLFSLNALQENMARLYENLIAKQPVCP